MDRRGGQYRTPSPSHPIQPGYQLEENPYSRNASHSQLDMPLQPPPGRYASPGDPNRYGTPMDNRMGTPSDQLALNAAVSWIRHRSKRSALTAVAFCRQPFGHALGL